MNLQIAGNESSSHSQRGSVGISTKHSWGVNHRLLWSLSLPVPTAGSCCAGRGVWTPTPLTDKGFSEMLAAQPVQRGHAQHPLPPVQMVILAFFLIVCCASAACSGGAGVHSCILAAVPSARLHGDCLGRSAPGKNPTC